MTSGDGRATETTVGRRHEFAPYEVLVDRVARERITAWRVIQDEFLRATGAFDTAYRGGGGDDSWYQCKARYLNDLILSLLRNISGKCFESRTEVRSALFSRAELDICFRSDDRLVVGGGVRQAGAPPRSGNGVTVRRGSSDLRERVPEVAITSVDVKRTHAEPIPIQSLKSWVDWTAPAYFSFWAVRANDDADLGRIRDLLMGLGAYVNGVAAFVYRPTALDQPTDYMHVPLHPLDIDTVVREVAQQVT